MASDHFSSSLSEQTIEEVESALPASTEHGADLRFRGVVRDREDGRLIRGIDYSHYPGMAERELEKIGAEMRAEFPGHLAFVHHRTGFVAAGEPSILIRVQTPHSAEAYEISREYLRRIKTTVPIWKRPVFTGEAT